MTTYPPLSLAEMFGLDQGRKRLKEVAFMLRGDPYTPPSRFGASSLQILMPRLSLQTWAGLRRSDRRVPIYNLFNHTPTPLEEGWSVRVTQVRDFRGKRRTYDSHNGTDFAVPVGTVVVAPAPGRVVRVSSEFHRGGLKVFLDHGQGLMTTSNHLGRSLVKLGQRVTRGEPIALAGASGVDMVTLFPWTAPHVHFNVWLDGEYVDPFAHDGQPSLWRGGQDPTPHSGPSDEQADEADWDFQAVQRAIQGCKDPALRKRLEQIAEPRFQAADTLFNLNYFPTRFSARPCLYQSRHARRPTLDLPFRPEEFVGIVHLDA